jgi:hypothetical protein
VFTTAGNLGHIAGIFAGFTAIVFAFRRLAIACRMGAFFQFFRHREHLFGLLSSNLMAMADG